MTGSEIIGKEELREIQDLFDKDKVILYRYGPGNYKTKLFEEIFAKYMGVKYAHAVSSGTAAIHSALAAVGITRGDEVITTSWTFVAPIEAIVSLGATPVLANIDSTFHPSIEEISKNITKKTKAVVSVPMWSSPDMIKLVDLCEKHNIILIEDSAQSLGASFKGKKLGTFGKAGTFSFDFGKTIHTGEGGMIVTNDREVYDKVAEFSDHGHMHVDKLPRGKDPRRKPGLNYRMSELTAAVGLAQMDKIDYILSKSTENKKYIKDRIINLVGLEFRVFNDEAGAQGDTLIFSLKNKKMALDFEKSLNESGYFTKILPEAIDWHYGGVWEHILPNFKFYKDKNLEEFFKPTGDLLRRSICLNIPVLMDKFKLDDFVDAIIGAHSKVVLS